MKQWKGLFLCLLLGVLLLSGCARNDDAAPTVPNTRWAQKKAEALTLVVTEEDFENIEKCENLRYLDITGSTCYDAILRYMASYPEVDVRYAVAMGSTIVRNTDTEITLIPEDGTYAILDGALNYLPQLQKIHLTKTLLTEQELENLQKDFPDRDFRWSLEILGSEYDQDTTEIDLSAMTMEQFEEVTGKVSRLEEIASIDLTGSVLTIADVKAVMDAFPDAQVRYSFDLFGQTLSTDTEKVDFTGQKIGNEGADAIREALSIMPKCTYFKLENCGMSNEVLGSIQADFPNAKIVWRIHFGGQYSILTDETTLRTVYGVEDSHNEYLKYCTSLKYIDMGHNDTLTDISFASYMPDLEILILSGSSIRNVDALANCKKLVFLEMANCGLLEDISALENCESLRFLNIGFTRVKDITPIWDLPLERFVCLGPKMDQEIRDAYEEEHPDCWVRFKGKDPLSLGWKYDDEGTIKSEYYLFIREVFDLDEVDARLAKQKAEEEARKEAEEAAKREEEEANKNTEPTTPPATEAPAPTDPPAAEPPATEAPATEPPATDPPAPAPDPAPEG